MRVRTLVTVLVVFGLLLGIGGYAASRYIDVSVPYRIATRPCTVTADGVVTLDAEQLANAATIAAVGIRRQLSERAITVALATAYQESKIRNLSGGDRDSVGLFQQRPSQGWGTVAQVSDPRYAAGKFYDKLVKIPGWESMRVTDAAQAVQISAHPELYEQWAGRAGILSKALHGAATQAVTCTFRGEADVRGAEAVGALLEEVVLDWGPSAAPSGGDALSLRPRDEQAGWQYAHWLVARAQSYGVRAVRYAGMEWTPARGRWERIASGQGSPGAVTAEVHP